MARQSPLVVTVLLCGLAGFASTPARGDPADPPAESAAGPDVEIPAGIPISLDGLPTTGEWDDAAMVVPPPKGFELKMKHTHGTLLVSLRLGRSWKPTWRFLLYAVPGASPGRYDARGAVRIDVEPFDHNRPHALVLSRSNDGTGPAAWQRTDDRVVFRTAGLSEWATLEGAIPLDLLGITGKDAQPLRWLAAFTAPGRSPSIVTFPEDLDLGPAQRGMPADLSTTARWARTARFAQADGRGAFAKTDWDAWVAADHELTARGESAHRSILEILQANLDHPASEFDEPQKRDGPIPAALDDLRWLAGREPWTHGDARAYAIAMWKSNRALEALAAARTVASMDPGPDAVEDLRVAAEIARDAEQFEEAATLYDREAALVPDLLAGEPRREATRMRALGALLVKELEARRADDAKGDLPLAMLTTAKGLFVVRLLEDDCPESARQFIHLAEETKGPDGQPFYDGTKFHHVIANGIVQGGDPTSRGDGCAKAGGGGSDWWIPAEKNPRHHFFRGSVGWVTATDRHVKSQFFVMTAPPKPTLDEKRMCCFGTVVAGMDVVDRMDVCDELLSVRIVRKRDHPYVPTKNK
jgi:cyclophilin family peptidyl-prolyl cis-trans isomerase